MPDARNSTPAIARRVNVGQVRWAGPLIVVAARSGLLVVAQALVAAVFALRGHPSAWSAAAPWWTVYGTLADVGCLLLIAVLARREGIRIRDLVGRPRLRWGRDALLGVGFFFLVVPFFLLAPFAGNWLVYGSWELKAYTGLLTDRVLPTWAVIYSLSIWWLVWSPTEETTYQGYVLPRLEVLSGRNGNHSLGNSASSTAALFIIGIACSV